MRFYGSLESLVVYSPKHPAHSPKQRGDLENTEDGSLDALLLGRVNSLGVILGHVEKDMAQRKALSENILMRIYYQYCYVKSSLIKTYMFGAHSSSGYSLRSKLEQQIFGLVQEVRTEKQKCWQDIARLNQEWRTWLKQYLDAMQRVRVIFPLNEKESKKIFGR